MTTINLQTIVPLQVTGLEINGTSAAILMLWNASGIATDVYEVWTKTTNDTPLSGTLLGTFSSNSATITSLPFNTANYFWVRIKNIYGSYGRFSSAGTLWADAAQFNILKVYAQLNFTHSTAVGFNSSLDYFHAQVSYLDSSNVSHTVNADFTTTVTQASEGGTNSWFNPDGARSTGLVGAGWSYGTYTNVTTYALVFTLGDLGVPTGALVTNLILYMTGTGGLPSSVTTTAIVKVYTPWSQQLATTSIDIPYLGTTATLTIPTTIWSTPAGGLQASWTASGPSIINTTSVSVGAGLALQNITYSPTAPSYGSWINIMSLNTFVASDNYVYEIYGEANITVAGISVTATQSLSLKFKWWLHDVTAAQALYAEYRSGFIYSGTGNPTSYTTNLVVNKEICGNGGILISGHTYQYHLAYRMDQLSNTPTATSVACVGTLSGESFIIT